MSDIADKAQCPPRPVIKTMRWPYPAIWIVPVLAAVAAGYYFYAELKNRGPDITIAFTDASGIKVGQTPVSHLGVPIGKVTGLQLSPDQKQVWLNVRLERTAGPFAQTGALFWIVRPEVSVTSIRGLDTITSGPYLEAMPGDGKPATAFVGLNEPPPKLGPGLTILLHAPRLERVQAGAPVNFRGIQVGVIQNIQLSADSAGIDVSVFIYRKFMPLVRANSQFWLIKGIDVEGGLFSGVSLKLDSLRSLISGGISFATPDTEQPMALDGAQYPLFEEAKKEWMEWSPRISLIPDDTMDNRNPIGLPQASGAVQSAVGNK